MKYLVSGKVRQFNVLCEAVYRYKDMYNGHICDYLYKVSLNAYQKRKKNESLSFYWNECLLTLVWNIVNNVEKIIYMGERNKEELTHKAIVLGNIYKKLNEISSSENQNEDISISFDSEEIRMLSHICDTITRFICGQTFAITDGLMECWCNLHKDEVDTYCEVRDLLQNEVRLLHNLCWNTQENSYYGINYDETSDMLFDMHQVFRHVLWEEQPEETRSYMTVDSDTPHNYSDYQLLIINKEKE